MTLVVPETRITADQSLISGSRSYYQLSGPHRAHFISPPLKTLTDTEKYSVFFLHQPLITFFRFKCVSTHLHESILPLKWRHFSHYELIQLHSAFWSAISFVHFFLKVTQKDTTLTLPVMSRVLTARPTIWWLRRIPAITDFGGKNRKNIDQIHVGQKDSWLDIYPL